MHLVLNDSFPASLNNSCYNVDSPKNNFLNRSFAMIEEKKK